MLYGRREDIVVNPPFSKQLERVFERSPEVRDKEGVREALLEKLGEISRNCRIHFVCGYDDEPQIGSGLPTKDSFDAAAYTSPDHVWSSSICIWMTIEIIQPLLRQDLTDAEL